ncbi:uncharacterized protein LOC118180667 [Stegodyphus dumicola]|uniref:uncharacterized protein LOC118180667 n=1 Tax=Stegodyphus dumicola TaxID=202533 RepID=UPI0015A8F6AD|nr:uncharacterized protein LOC118180667 [Stegodyphus dumicola]
MSRKSILTTAKETSQGATSAPDLLDSDLPYADKITLLCADIRKGPEGLLIPELVDAEVNTSTILCCEAVRQHSFQSPVLLFSPSTADQALAPAPSFADIVRRPKKPSLIIRPKADTTSDTLKEQLNTKVPLSQLKVGIDRITKINNGGLEVFCQTPDDVAILEQELTRSDVPADVSRPIRRKPRIAIHDLPESITPQTVLSELSGATGLPETAFTMRFRLRERRKGYIKWIVECDSPGFAAVMRRRKIFVGWQAHRATEFIGIKRCYSCQQYGHVQTECKSKRKYCSYCAGDHGLKDCTAQTLECINCGEANNRYGTRYDFAHPAYHRDCPEYQRRVQLIGANTDY